MGMLVARRLRDLVIVLLLVGTATFFMIHLIPGSPAVAMLGPYATQEQIDALNEAMGFDKPVVVQYFAWLGNAATGDLGESIGFGQPVTEVIAAHAAPTIIIAVTATVLSLLIAVPIAVRAAAKPRSLTARLLTPLSVFGLAIPGFWMALVLLLVFGATLKWVPVSGWINPLTDPVRGIKYLTLPVIVLSTHQVALFVNTLRESISGELLSTYLRTARAKGLRERAVLYRHVLPNALLPTITVVATSFGHLLGGVIILESIFVIPGWGLTLFNAITARDYPLIIGLTLVVAVIFVLLNLIADLLYVYLDPKVRVS